MLNEFYDFIAKRINSFFQTASAEGILLKGESFCLKLDDDEMVKNVAVSLRKLLESNNILGQYEYACGDGSVYKTFTLQVQNDEIIIAAQIDGMTNDFLCATLRNAANDEQKPLLMISSNLIDSAKSGSRDMSASGMPFHADELMREIREMVNDSTLLTDVEKRVLCFELDRRDEDVFSDKSSIYEYCDLLAIMSSGRIDSGSFSGFRLFPMDGKNEYKNYGTTALDKLIKNNNALFEKIDRGIRFGDLELVLSKDFEESFILKIERAQKEYQDEWSRMFSYAELLAAMDKHNIKKSHPLEIGNESITVYGDMPLNMLALDENLLIRNEGSQKSKKRTKNLFIFNPNHYSRIHIQINCGYTKITNNGLFQDDGELVRDGQNLIFAFDGGGISFHKIELKDITNDISYILKICIMDFSAEYMFSTIRHSAVIEYKKSRKNCRVKLVGVTTSIIFNPNGMDVISARLNDNEVYKCSYGQKLIINSTDEELTNLGGGIKIDVDFAGTVVPFSLYPDESKSVEITGKRIFRDKHANRKCFYFDGNSIYSDSQEYFAKANLLRELKLEKQIIDKNVLYGKCSETHLSEGWVIKGEELILPENLRIAYFDFLAGFKAIETVPTLAYFSEDLYELAVKYLLAFEACFSDLEDGSSLSIEQENALLLGTLMVDKTEKEILYSPFHPLNVKYQIELAKENGMDYATDIIIERLNSLNLLPYIQKNKKIYKVSDEQYSLEWKYYAPIENKKYRGSRKYVPKLVDEKISEFFSHFRYIFDDINNRTIRINLINLGDCSEVFVGVAQFFIRSINKNTEIDKLAKFEIHIYGKDMSGNSFNSIREYSVLKKYLSDLNLSIEHDKSMNSLEGILAKNIECYFHEDCGKDYTYAHISFYEMESEITSEMASMEMIETGISLGGIISGVPSSKYGHKYRTGFGSKYVKMDELVRLSILYNSLMQVEATGNPYYCGTGISTQIDELAEKKMDYIYRNSNWVVFVDPKVDLDFFTEKEANSDLLIIHYSDQYTSSSGYDAITVTHKSQQYSQVIREYLKDKGIDSKIENVHSIINLFNAVNGDWLLRLVSSKKTNKESTFSREKISIVAAIKFMLAYLRHDNIVWVPISLEEMLRVSGGAGLSKDEGVLSAKNLGFEKGPTSDDLLFVGIDNSNTVPHVYMYPVEVKTGNNDSTVIKKAFEQVSSTAKGLKKAFNPDGDIVETILYKVNRNFLMQLIISSCKKMKIYNVDDAQNWDIILDENRCLLLNEGYILSENIQEVLGKGAVISFGKSNFSRRTSFKEDSINFIELPEEDEFGLIIKNASDIHNDIEKSQSEEILHFGRCVINNLTGDVSKLNTSSYGVESGEVENQVDYEGENGKDSQDDYNQGGLNQNDGECVVISSDAQSGDQEQGNTSLYGSLNGLLGETSKTGDAIITDNIVIDNDDMNTNDRVSDGMQILFGYNEQDGKPVIWRPNDTSQLFHTNTGIIGTMGTGKTQFTKSLITQLYDQQKNNVDGKELGILIFDYKGDYNESKKDFVEATDAKVLLPYKLPFNPLALTKSSVFKPLLPIHTANAFKDTISKVYGLGPKQQNTLLQCIMEAYKLSGINPAVDSTWENEAPTFDQVYQRYISDEDIKKGDSLSAAFEKLNMFQVFESDPSKTKSLFEILNGVVVIDLSSYDPDIQSLVIAITLDLFYSQMQSAGSSKMEGNNRQLTKMILVDEADNFMSEGFPSLKKILKEGREFGVGTILSTQFLKHFGSGDDDYSAYILSWIVHNVSDLKNSDIDFVFKTESKSPENNRLFSAIKSLTKHHSIIKIGNSKPIYLKDKPFYELYNEMNFS